MYRQRLLFLFDSDVKKGYAWIESKLGVGDADGALRKFGENPAQGSSFAVETVDQGYVFIIWVKSFDGSARDIALLSHECLHATIQMLSYIGYEPKLVHKNSEPICYLQGEILRTCLEQILR